MLHKASVRLFPHVKSIFATSKPLILVLTIATTSFYVILRISKCAVILLYQVKPVKNFQSQLLHHAYDFSIMNEHGISASIDGTSKTQHSTTKSNQISQDSLPLFIAREQIHAYMHQEKKKRKRFRKTRTAKNQERHERISSQGLEKR